MSRRTPGDELLTVEQMRRLCPPCADSMERKGLTAVKKTAVAKQLAEKLVDTFGQGVVTSYLGDTISGVNRS